MERKLEKLEDEWAKFCENASEVKARLEANHGKWKGFQSEVDKMMTYLSECKNVLDEEIERGIDIQAVDIELKKFKVRGRQNGNSFVLILQMHLLILLHPLHRS